ncbi:hypothetical protein [Aquisalimonas sp.]|uniref:hypothetical protein n=1 Tax=Aquisalimonas sp. TaxID=1872621 RepID=UPI0025C5B067|nr:hypothetical protein [Aquisalimonas sp.]
MTHYVCTVEYRDPESGVMQHYTQEINAPDGDHAGDATERAFMESLAEEHGDLAQDVEIVEIVCRAEGNH